MAGLNLVSWTFENLVGILFALAAHTTLTRLRNRMFLNVMQQDVNFYDSHSSGELSSRLINDSGQLQTLAQFTTQQFLQVIESSIDCSMQRSIDGSMDCSIECSVQAAVQLVGSLCAMYFTHPLLALLATLISPLNTLLIRRAGKVIGLCSISRIYHIHRILPHLAARCAAHLGDWDVRHRAECCARQGQRLCR